MAEGSTRDSDDDEGEGNESDDDEGSIDRQNSPSKPARPLSNPLSNPLSEIPPLTQQDTEMAGTEATEATAPPPLLHLKEKLDMKSGSPLKNVLTPSALTSPLESPSIYAAPFFQSTSAPAPVSLPSLEPVLDLTKPTSLDQEMQQQAIETAPPTLPSSPPPAPALAEELASKDVLAAEEEEEEMLLDIMENANNAAIGGAETVSVPVSAVDHEEDEIPPDSLPLDAPELPLEEREVSAPEVAGEEDDFPDLLGGLEKRLNESAVPAVASAVLPENPVNGAAVRDAGAVGEEKKEA